MSVAFALRLFARNTLLGAVWLVAMFATVAASLDLTDVVYSNLAVSDPLARAFGTMAIAVGIATLASAGLLLGLRRRARTTHPGRAQHA